MYPKNTLWRIPLDVANSNIKILIEIAESYNELTQSFYSALYIDFHVKLSYMQQW